MRAQDALAGALGFASLGASIPGAMNYGPLDTCVPSISTVFVTVQQATATVTVHDGLCPTFPSIADALNSAGSKMAAGVGTSKAPVYDATTTKTAVVTVTQILNSTAAGDIFYIVEDGTTRWLNGQTPLPSVSYAHATSVVTVVPTPSIQETRTTTLTSTILVTSAFTVTQKIGLNSTYSSITTTNTPPFVGTGSTFTGMAAGGWNATSTSKAAISNGAAGFSGQSYASMGLVISKSSFDVYHTKSEQPSITISSLVAQSGFTQSPVTSDPPSSSQIPPFANSTSVESTAANAGVSIDSSSASTSSSLSIVDDSNLTTTAFTSPSSSILQSSFTTLTSPSSTSLSGIATTTPGQTSTSKSSTTSATPSFCGEIGDFTLNFDDIPPLSIGNQSIDTVQPAPLFNPYHQFDFSNGFTVVPPPRTPYAPSSRPLFLEFIPNFGVNQSSANTGPNSQESGFSGAIGSGDHGATGCFSFNVYGASFGCDSKGPDCLFTFTGYRYDRATQLTNQITTLQRSIQACPTLTTLNSCPLTPLTLDSSFENLDAVLISLMVGGLPKIWWMDDLRLGWYDNACEKGLCRQNAHLRRVRSLVLDDVQASTLN